MQEMPQFAQRKTEMRFSTARNGAADRCWEGARYAGSLYESRTGGTGRGGKVLLWEVVSKIFLLMESRLSCCVH